MKCGVCGTKNEAVSKFCKECGAQIIGSTASQPTHTLNEMYGKDVEVLFFVENYTGKISGIVNPTEDQVGRYREAILQKVTISAPVQTPSDENTGMVLTFIRQSKEYLGEDYNEGQYRHMEPSELKKEYLKLFEKVLKAKNKMDAKPGAPVPPVPKAEKK